jgi:hypothetical protein
MRAVKKRFLARGTAKDHDFYVRSSLSAAQRFCKLRITAENIKNRRATYNFSYSLNQ